MGLAEQALAWQEEEEEELQRRGRAPFKRGVIAPDGGQKNLAHTSESLATSKLVARKLIESPNPTFNSLMSDMSSPATQGSRSARVQKDSRVRSLWPAQDAIEETMDMLLQQAAQTPNSRDWNHTLEKLQLRDTCSDTSESCWSPGSTASSFKSIRGLDDISGNLDHVGIKLAEEGMELLKTARSFGTQTRSTSFTPRQSFATAQQRARELKPMPCTRHHQAVNQSGQPQPSFRSRMSRFAAGWEEGAGGVPASMMYRGSNLRVGPGTYLGEHKDRYGNMQMGPRSHTIWDLHVFD